MSARRTDSGLDGILAVDKPAGWTSHDVVARARGILKQRRAGHTGTLDPMATGLLVLCLGRATRLVEYMVGHDKRYVGRIALGVTTATDDAEGEVLTRRPVPTITPELLEPVLERFRGDILQRPPAFSAVKIAGQRSYHLARQGKPTEIPPRPVTIRAFTVTGINQAALDIDVTCSAGTYIRSLARDIGEELGCGAHLSALRRLRVGPLRVEHAVTLDQLQQLATAGRLEDFLLPADEGVSSLDAAILSSDGLRVFTNGGVCTAQSGTSRGAARARIYGVSGEFAGVASVSSFGEIKPLKVFGRRKSA